MEESFRCSWRLGLVLRDISWTLTRHMMLNAQPILVFKVQPFDTSTIYDMNIHVVFHTQTFLVPRFDIEYESNPAFSASKRSKSFWSCPDGDLGLNHIHLTC